MKNVLTILALLLSVTVYAGKEKKNTKQKQELVKQQPVQQADTTTKGKAHSYWEQDLRLGRHLHVKPTKETK